MSTGVFQTHFFSGSGGESRKHVCDWERKIGSAQPAPLLSLEVAKTFRGPWADSRVALGQGSSRPCRVYWSSSTFRLINPFLWPCRLTLVLNRPATLEVRSAFLLEERVAGSAAHMLSLSFAFPFLQNRKSPDGLARLKGFIRFLYRFAYIGNRLKPDYTHLRRCCRKQISSMHSNTECTKKNYAH